MLSIIFALWNPQIPKYNSFQSEAWIRTWFHQELRESDRPLKHYLYFSFLSFKVWLIIYTSNTRVLNWKMYWKYIMQCLAHYKPSHRLLFMFPYPRLELVFMVLDLYPKTTGQGRYGRKRTSSSLTKESMSLEIPNWRRKTITNHEG